MSELRDAVLEAASESIKHAVWCDLLRYGETCDCPALNPTAVLAGAAAALRYVNDWSAKQYDIADQAMNDTYPGDVAGRHYRWGHRAAQMHVGEFVRAAADELEADR